MNHVTVKELIKTLKKTPNQNAEVKILDGKYLAILAGISETEGYTIELSTMKTFKI